MKLTQFALIMACSLLKPCNACNNGDTTVQKYIEVGCKVVLNPEWIDSTRPNQEAETNAPTGTVDTSAPTRMGSSAPSNRPSGLPTGKPTGRPTNKPTSTPTGRKPSAAPSLEQSTTTQPNGPKKTRPPVGQRPGIGGSSPPTCI